MPKKRASRGRTKGGKGSSGTVHCSQCGAMVPRDKAKKPKVLTSPRRQMLNSIVSLAQFIEG